MLDQDSQVVHQERSVLAHDSLVVHLECSVLVEYSVAVEQAYYSELSF